MQYKRVVIQHPNDTFLKFITARIDQIFLHKSEWSKSNLPDWRQNKGNSSLLRALVRVCANKIVPLRKQWKYLFPKLSLIHSSQWQTCKLSCSLRWVSLSNPKASLLMNRERGSNTLHHSYTHFLYHNNTKGNKPLKIYAGFWFKALCLSHTAE